MRVAPMHVIVLIAAMSGCLTSGLGPSTPFLVSSETSDYLPAGRFRGTLALEDHVLHVHAESLMVIIPGPLTSASPPVVRDLELHVLLGAPESSPRGWRPVARSAESVTIPGSLRIGERRAIGPASFTLVMPDHAARDSLWLVFQFTGEATRLAGHPQWQAVETYACEMLPWARHSASHHPMAHC